MKDVGSPQSSVRVARLGAEWLTGKVQVIKLTSMASQRAGGAKGPAGAESVAGVPLKSS